MKHRSEEAQGRALPGVAPGVAHRLPQRLPSYKVQTVTNLVASIPVQVPLLHIDHQPAPPGALESTEGNRFPVLGQAVGEKASVLKPPSGPRHGLWHVSRVRKKTTLNYCILTF